MQVYENPASCNSFYKCENGTATAEVGEPVLYHFSQIYFSNTSNEFCSSVFCHECHACRSARTGCCSTRCWRTLTPSTTSASTSGRPSAGRGPRIGLRNLRKIATVLSCPVLSYPVRTSLELSFLDQ